MQRFQAGRAIFWRSYLMGAIGKNILLSTVSEEVASRYIKHHSLKRSHSHHTKMCVEVSCLFSSCTWCTGYWLPCMVTSDIEVQILHVWSIETKVGKDGKAFWEHIWTSCPKPFLMVPILFPPFDSCRFMSCPTGVSWPSRRRIRWLGFPWGSVCVKK